MLRKDRRWHALTLLSSALFLISIDATVLYTALPTLTRDLAATAVEKLWIINIYALVVAALLPGFGPLGDRVGHRRIFACGLVVFALASLGAALALTPALLIASRALLGLGAAMMMPSTLSLIRLTFADKKERALALGIWGAIAAGGAALGPIVGGALLEHFWWGSVFLVNVPIALLVLALVGLWLPKSKVMSRRPWDWRGSVQIMLGLTGITYALKEICIPGASCHLAALTGALGLAALWAFGRRQANTANPLIDFSLFKEQKFSIGMVVAIVASLIMIGVELIVSQRLQLVLGYSPWQAALRIVPIPIAAFLAGPLAGWALPRLGSRAIMTSSLWLTGLGLVTLLFTYGSAGAAQGLSLAALGLGIGAGGAAASNAIMNNAPSRLAGMAASLEEVSFELGAVLGVAIFGSILTAVYSASLVLPGELANFPAASDSLDAALLVSENLQPETARLLVETARAAFDKAFLAIVGLALALALGTAIFLSFWGRRRNKAA